MSHSLFSPVGCFCPFEDFTYIGQLSRPPAIQRQEILGTLRYQQPDIDKRTVHIGLASIFEIFTQLLGDMVVVGKQLLLSLDMELHLDLRLMNLHMATFG